MKKMPLFVISFLIMTGCNKGDGVQPAELEHYPQYWILTVEEDADHYIFLKTNGAVMYRDHILKSYNLITLAEEEECKWIVEQSRTEDGGKICFSIRLDKNKKMWMGAGPSSNGQEKHAYVTNTSSTDPGDNYKWFIHKRPDQYGVKTVVLENVYYPGYYLSSYPPGFQFAQNLVTLDSHTGPDQATEWQCR